jgi:para-aminobenzoate synthetase/4-amino-4-deoxychorismate lyase
VNKAPLVLLESYAARGETSSYAFAGCVEVIEAHAHAEVLPSLRRVETAVASGLHAAGFLAYEAAPGLDPDLAVRTAGEFPFLWFGLFRKRVPVFPGALCADAPPCATSGWAPSLAPRRYAALINRIRELISAGDTYQVNFTLRERFHLSGSPLALYRDLCRSQPAPYCAFIDTGRFSVASASPELFFRLDGDILTTRPMKGTARRGRWPEEDEAAKEELRRSDKERAENLMIVDLLRNDLGKVAQTGSVEVNALFEVEPFPTVHQMTSTITARLREGVGFPELFRALFPCGSVTGAPKRRTMEIIASLEDSPRGIYTGCIGYISPGREAVFSVAIRTAVIDTATGTGELGIGSGITWDSRPAAEYDECLAKARFAREPFPEFQLIESLLFTPGEGYFLLDRHLGRMAASASRFGFAFGPDAARDRLLALGADLDVRQKVRLLLSRDGTLHAEAAPIDVQEGDTPLAVAFAGGEVDSRDPLLYHKTTWRTLYSEELRRHPDCADVIFCNERGEVTEGTYHNVVARIGDVLVTPPVTCGLLPGVFREELLAGGAIREQVLTREDFAAADEIYLINSVRRWRRARLV